MGEGQPIQIGAWKASGIFWTSLWRTIRGWKRIQHLLTSRLLGTLLILVLLCSVFFSLKNMTQVYRSTFAIEQTDLFLAHASVDFLERYCWSHDLSWASGQWVWFRSGPHVTHFSGLLGYPEHILLMVTGSSTGDQPSSTSTSQAFGYSMSTHIPLAKASHKATTIDERWRHTPFPWKWRERGYIFTQ